MAASSTSGVKSAYELALERLEEEGIERPNESALSGQTRASIGELRERAQARLAELEILQRDNLASVSDPSEREKVEKEYVAERGRIENKRDRDIERLRSNDRQSG